MILLKQFNPGDIVYFIASNRIVKEAKVTRNGSRRHDKTIWIYAGTEERKRDG